MNDAPTVAFGQLLSPNRRPYTLASDEDADLVGMRLYGLGPFHRELKPAEMIRKKTHFVIREGDVIYNKLFAWKGTFGIVPPELDGMLVSDKFPTYELDSSRVSPEYLRWCFRLPSLWEQARRLSVGSAALSKLTLNPPRFLELEIPLPPLAKQQHVAETLDRLHGGVQQLARLHDLMAQQIAALVPVCLSRLAAREASLGVLGDVLLNKPRNGWSARCDDDPMGTPVLALGAVTGFHYRPREYKRTSLPTSPDAHYWLRPGDLLMTRSNTPELVGHAAIYTGEPAPCIYPDLVMRLPVNRQEADVRFVWYWLQSPLVRDFVRGCAKGTSSTMTKISQGTVHSIPFPSRMSAAEQRDLAANLDEVGKKARLAISFVTKARAQADSLWESGLSRALGPSTPAD